MTSACNRSGWRLLPVVTTAMITGILLAVVTGCSMPGTNGTQARQPAAAEQESAAAAQPTRDSDGPQVQALRLRVEAYWTAWRNQDYLTMYQMLAVANPRGNLDAAKYYQRMSKSMRLLGFSIESVELTGPQTGKVHVKYAQGLVSQGKTFPIKDEAIETWSLIDGEWYDGRASSGN